MDTWLVGADDVARLLDVFGRDVIMKRMIDALELTFSKLGREECEGSPARTGFSRDGDTDPTGVIEIMPHREPGSAVTVKTISYSPENRKEHGLPTILGTAARIEDGTGRLVALTDAVLLTAMRTGAASAIATRRLARPDSSVVGMLGTGAQAVTQLHGLSHVLDISRVIVHDTDADNARSFAKRVEFLGVDVDVRPREEILGQADVICTATSVAAGAGPVFEDGPHQPHLHINSIGADEIGKTELPKPLLERAWVCVDHRDQALNEGESQQLREDQVGPTLAEVCAYPANAVGRRYELTVFDSTGFAFEDHVAMNVMLDAAAELGVGTKLAIEGRPDDVLDPYSVRTTRRHPPIPVVEDRSL